MRTRKICLTRQSSGIRRPAFSWLTMIRWFDAWAGIDGALTTEPKRSEQIDWVHCIPFISMHALCFGVVWVGWSWSAIGIAAALYAARMFAITAFYHRYFSHRAFKTSRFWQMIFAIVGASALQRGPLWWAAHHRHHHATADQEGDVHSPSQHGVLWSHMGWFNAPANFATKLPFVRDFAKFPELCWIDRFDIVVAAGLAVLLYGLGTLLAAFFPDSGTSGAQVLIWGFGISTVVLYHATYTINSLAHVIGRRRYATQDNSGNSALLALLTFGEGWHNNHHYYPASARQGFYWWEIDPTYCLLAALSWIGVVWDLNIVPERVRLAGRMGVGAL
jgi:stearoyl-CoA desaturase (Delta-9 desaturase)